MYIMCINNMTTLYTFWHKLNGGTIKIDCTTNIKNMLHIFRDAYREFGNEYVKITLYKIKHSELNYFDIVKIINYMGNNYYYPYKVYDTELNNNFYCVDDNLIKFKNMLDVLNIIYKTKTIDLDKIVYDGNFDFDKCDTVEIDGHFKNSVDIKKSNNYIKILVKKVTITSNYLLKN